MTITTISTPLTVMTEQQFFDRQVALWGFDEVMAWIEEGYAIVPNGDNGFKWELTDRTASATMRQSHTNGA